MYAKKKEAKGKYRQRIKGHFENTDPRSMWRGIKTLSDYKYKTTVMTSLWMVQGIVEACLWCGSSSCNTPEALSCIQRN